jgi:hypothetical protein
VQVGGGLKWPPTVRNEDSNAQERARRACIVGGQQSTATTTTALQPSDQTTLGLRSADGPPSSSISQEVRKSLDGRVAFGKGQPGRCSNVARESLYTGSLRQYRGTETVPPLALLMGAPLRAVEDAQLERASHRDLLKVVRWSRTDLCFHRLALCCRSAPRV